MKIIVALCLVVFAACESNPDIVHPNERLIEEAQNLMTHKDSRIINGDDVDITEYPWQASLHRSGSHSCGAAIVGEYYAITAAHCVEGVHQSYLRLRVGSSQHAANGHIVYIDAIIMHENYNSGQGTFPNDIAVLRTSTSLYQGSATKVNLPTKGQNFDGQQCEITGWGITESGGIPTELQMAKTTVITKSECRSHWGWFSINDGHVCVHTGINGACMGDSGGPLTCGGVLAGVTSWGNNECRTNYPSVYTRISYFRDWIEGITGL